MNTKGYSLVELLVVSALALIIGVGLFRVANDVIRSNTQSSAMIRNTDHLNFVVGSAAKILATAGFGIDRDNLDYRKVIDITDNGRKLIIQTRASTSDRDSGCWGYIDTDGNFRLAVSNDDIPSVSLSMYSVCPSDANSYPVKLSINDKSLNCQKNCVAFYNPSVIQVEVYYDSTTASGCLVSTGRGMIKLGSNINPFVSCVADMRFLYMYEEEKVIKVSQTRPNYQSLKGVRLCMIVQLTESGGQSVTEPQYSERCGGSRISQINSSVNWRKAKWAIVERDIMMPNLYRP